MPDSNSPTPPIRESMAAFLDYIGSRKSKRTRMTYANALSLFLDTLPHHGLNPDSPSGSLDENCIRWIADAAVKAEMKPSTERLYATALTRFLKYLAAEG